MPGFDGMEFLSESPVGRRLYRAGEEVELDETRPDVKQSAKDGRIREIKEAKTTIVATETKED